MNHSEYFLNASKDNPVGLKIVGESQAGSRFAGTVEADEAVRISTGAILADGCDTVVRVEDTEERNQTVHVRHVRSQGQDIRRCSEGFARGELLLARGTRLGSAVIALIAGVGEVGVRFSWGTCIRNPSKKKQQPQVLSFRITVRQSIAVKGRLASAMVRGL